jgi:hypothetical protein
MVEALARGLLTRTPAAWIKWGRERRTSDHVYTTIRHVARYLVIATPNTLVYNALSILRASTN